MTLNFITQPINYLVKIAFRLITLFSLSFFIFSGFHWNNHWDQITQRGHLKVAIRESEGIYWPSSQELSGLEHDLLTEIERYTNTPIQFFAVRNLSDLYHALEVGAVDMALPGTSLNQSRFPQSESYLTSKIGLVTYPKSAPPSEDSLTGILDPIGHQDAILFLQSGGQTIRTHNQENRLSGELLTQVSLQKLSQALIDERDFRLQQHAFPSLTFTPLELPPRELSILFAPNEDGSLSTRINKILQSFKSSGILNRITDRYLGDALRFNYVNNLTFNKHLKNRLPAYQKLFEKYADQFQLDWRLLAAVGYQESHWRKNAVSPTLVRGLMMITMATAKEMGISNREDPEQSIYAGAKYIDKLKKRIPKRIQEPDRTWLALAAYNVGYGHLLDAQRITQLLNENPDNWIDVRKHLPKLALQEYQTWTKYGYARGSEPVIYVANIRRYYEKLKVAFPMSSDDPITEGLDQLPTADVPIYLNR